MKWVVQNLFRDDSVAYHVEFKTKREGIAFFRDLGYSVDTDFRCGSVFFLRTKPIPKWRDIPQYIKDNYIFRAYVLKWGFAKDPSLLAI